MKTAAVSVLLLLVVTIGVVVFSAPSTTANLRRRLQDDSVEKPPSIYENKSSLNPALFSALTFSGAGRDEQFELKRQFYQNMVLYHHNMRPCLHKSFYGAIGFINPSMTEGLDTEHQYFSWGGHKEVVEQLNQSLNKNDADTADGADTADDAK